MDTVKPVAAAATAATAAANAGSLTEVDPALWMEMEERRSEREERELQLKESQLALQQQVGRKLVGLALFLRTLLTISILLFTVGGVVALFLAQSSQARERSLTEARQKIERQRFEFEALSAALSAPEPQQRARNVSFLMKAGYLTNPTLVARLRASTQEPATLPYLPALAAAAAPSAAVVEVVERPVVPKARQPEPPPSPRPAPEAASPVSPQASGNNAGSAAMDNQPGVSGGQEPRGNNRYARAQEVLRARGYYTGPVDDRYDPNTRAAVARFQREHGLDEDGMLGPETLRAIQEVAQGQPQGRRKPPR